MKMRMPRTGAAIQGKGLVKRGVSWLQCFTEWAECQAELLIMTVFIIAAKVLL